MKPPKTIKIAGVDWKVERVKDLKSSDGRGAWGLCSVNDETISLEKDFPSRAKEVDTILHEVIHALLEEYQAGLRRNDEEKVCTILGHGLRSVFADNPRLVAYVQECLK